MSTPLVFATNLPAAQFWHPRASPAAANLPASHGVQSARASVPLGAAAAVVLPAAQLLQVAPVAVPSATRGRYVPTAQLVHTDAPAAANLPATQAAHEADPDAPANLPGSQVLHVAAVLPPTCARYVPVAHGWQPRGSPCAANLPASQATQEANPSPCPEETVLPASHGLQLAAVSPLVVFFTTYVPTAQGVHADEPLDAL